MLYAALDPALSQESLRLLGWVEGSDYLDVLVAPGFEQEVIGQGLCLWAERECSQALDLRPMPASSPTREAAIRAAHQLRLEAVSAIEEVCPVVTLPATWQGYLATLKKKDRHELRRKLRNAEQGGAIAWYIASPWEDVAHNLPPFFQLHRTSRSEKAAFLTARMQALFTDVAVELAKRNWLWLAFLLIDGEPAASYLLFDFQENMLVCNSGYNPMLAGEPSPG